MVKNKKGQFYLIAAILIVSIGLGVLTISNYTSQVKKQTLSEMEQEIKIESSKIIDYGIYNNLDSNEINVLFTGQFYEVYLNKIGEKDFVFVFGEANNFVAIGNSATEQEFSINIEGSFTNFTNSLENFTNSYTPTGNEFTIKLGENSYSHDILEGQNFYYLVSKEDRGEKEIISG